MQAIYGSHGDTPRVVCTTECEGLFLHRAGSLPHCKKYSTQVIILSDQALSSRIEVLNEPDWDVRRRAWPDLLHPRRDSSPTLSMA